MVHLAGVNRLTASASPFAVPAGPETDGLTDVGGDALGAADVERQARPGKPRVELLAAQEAGQPARTRQQLDRLADDRLNQGLPGPAKVGGLGVGRRVRGGGARSIAGIAGLVVAGTVAEPVQLHA